MSPSERPAFSQTVDAAREPTRCRIPKAGRASISKMPPPRKSRKSLSRPADSNEVEDVYFVIGSAKKQN